MSTKWRVALIVVNTACVGWLWWQLTAYDWLTPDGWEFWAGIFIIALNAISAIGNTAIVVVECTPESEASQ